MDKRYVNTTQGVALIENDCFKYSESSCNPRFPHLIEITREDSGNGNPFEEESKEHTLYIGSGRSYKKGSTKNDKGFLVDSRIVALQGGLKGIKTNDKIKIEAYGYVENGYVVDVQIYMRGRGTNIYWDYERV